MRRFEKVIILVMLACAFAVRLQHLAGELDEPMWRQTDTAYMARRMLGESPPDMLNPKAPYRGRNDVKAAEFPIYPATVALVYKALGRESLPAARVVSLLFFTGAVWFLFLSVRILAGGRIAAWTSVLYSLAPLGIAYSRMVHPDFAIIFFSHLFLYSLLRFVGSARLRWWLVATLAATAAFLMKAPYCFFLGLLPGWWWLTDSEKRTVARLAGLASVLVLPLIAAVWFNNHRIAQEAPFEESLVYPMKWTAESSAGRFFGQLSERADLEGWKTIVKRMIFMVLTPVGVVIALIGLFPLGRYKQVAIPYGREWVPWLWLLGAGIYVLLVFPMVIGGHEYYTIPLMAPGALIAARGLVHILDITRSVRRRYATLSLAVIAALLLAGVGKGLAKGPYLSGFPFFDVDWQRVAAGQTIREKTGADDLVLSVTHGRSTGWSDPRILYYADRIGWTIGAVNLTADNLAAFEQAGATVAAVLVTPEAEPRESELGPLAGRTYRETRLVHDGNDIGSVRFYDLKDAASE